MPNSQLRVNIIRWTFDVYNHVDLYNVYFSQIKLLNHLSCQKITIPLSRQVGASHFEHYSSCRSWQLEFSCHYWLIDYMVYLSTCTHAHSLEGTLHMVPLYKVTLQSTDSRYIYIILYILYIFVFIYTYIYTCMLKNILMNLIDNCI